MTVEGWVVISNMDNFSSLSGNLFTVLVCYPEVGDVGIGVGVGNSVYVNCTGDMTIVLFYSIFQTSAGFSHVWKVATFFWAEPFVDYALF